MARSFNGTTDKIDFGTSVGAPANGTPYPFSLSAWFNPSTLAFPNSNGTYAAICGRNSAINDNYIMYLRSDKRIGWYINGAASSTHVDPGTNSISAANTWNNIAFTCNFSVTSALAYLNGVLDATLPQNADASSVNHFQVGADNNNPGSFNFPGLIADVAMWTVVLTAGEIAALANGARPSTIRPQSLILFSPLYGNISPESDLSGGAFSGTLTGTTLGTSNPPINLLTPRRPQFLAAPIVIAPYDMPSIGAFVCA